jgi:predicted signal transduction protein with EAL and GGDEF domain
VTNRLYDLLVRWHDIARHPDEEQLAMIQSLNFAFLQGYYIARPMPAEQFRAFYAENSARALITPQPHA